MNLRNSFSQWRRKIGGFGHWDRNLIRRLMWLPGRKIGGPEPKQWSADEGDTGPDRFCGERLTSTWCAVGT